jgi:hypothetical protein
MDDLQTYEQIASMRATVEEHLKESQTVLDRLAARSKGDRDLVEKAKTAIDDALQAMRRAGKK